MVEVTVDFGLDPFPIGCEVRGWVQRGQGSQVMRVMSRLKLEAGQGLISIDLDPKSDLAKLGIFQNGQVGYFFDATAHCHLVMSQN